MTVLRRKIFSDLFAVRFSLQILNIAEIVCKLNIVKHSTDQQIKTILRHFEFKTFLIIIDRDQVSDVVLTDSKHSDKRYRINGRDQENVQLILPTPQQLKVNTNCLFRRLKSVVTKPLKFT